MSGSQQLVGAAGLGLVVANAYTSQRAELSGLWSAQGDLSQAHTAAKQIGLETLGVGGLVLVAGVSNGAARTCLAVLGCLWVVFLMTRSAPTYGPGHLGPIGKAVQGAIPKPGQFTTTPRAGTVAGTPHNA
jgi:hypothetical protein